MQIECNAKSAATAAAKIKPLYTLIIKGIGFSHERPMPDLNKNSKNKTANIIYFIYPYFLFLDYATGLAAAGHYVAPGDKTAHVDHGPAAIGAARGHYGASKACNGHLA